MDRINRRIEGAGAVRVVDREQFVVDYLASTENICDDGLRLLVPRWNISRFQKTPVMPWCHTYKPKDGFDARPVAVARGCKRDTEGAMFGRPGLVIRAQFNGLEHGNAFAHSIALHVIDGRLPAISAGFRPINPERITEGQRTFFQPQQQILTEASPCVLGMDEDALAQIARMIDDPVERAAFQATSRGFGKAVGFPIDALPEHVRAICAGDVDVRDAGPDSWLEDGFVWEGRTYEVQGGEPAKPAEPPPATATTRALPTDVIDTAVAAIQKAATAVNTALFGAIKAAGSNASEELVDVCSYVIGLAGQMQAAAASLVAIAAGVPMGEEDASEGEGEGDMAMHALRPVSARALTKMLGELEARMNARFDDAEQSRIDLWKEQQTSQDSAPAMPARAAEGPKPANAAAEPPAAPTTRIASDDEARAFLRALVGDVVDLKRGKVTRASLGAGRPSP